MGRSKWHLAVETPTRSVPLIKFANGCLRQSRRMPVRVYERKDKNTSEKGDSNKVFVAGTEHVDYVGEPTRNNSSFQQILAVEDGNKLRLFPTDVVTLSPFIQWSESRPKEKQNDTCQARVDALASAFGSKRKRRAVESRQKLHVQESRLQLSANATLEEIQQSAVLEERVDVACTASVIPPRNKDAAIPQDVYRIEDIIQEEDYPYLDHLANPLLNASTEDIAQWRANATYSDYVLQRVQRLSKEPQNRVLEARLLVYCQLLVNLSRMRSKDFQRKDPLPNIEEPVKQKLLNMFTLSSKNEQGTGKRTFPERSRDKVFAYLIVLMLILEDYKVDLLMVQPDTKVSTSRLTNIAYALGCHVVTRKLPGSHTGTKYLVLKLPLLEGLHIKRKRK